MRDKGSAIIHLDDEDPTAMMVVLFLLHHNSDRVPAQVSVENLWHVAVIADKYNVAPALTLWVKGNEAMMTIDAASGEIDWRWLFISCVFKLQDVFRSVTKAIILNTGFPEDSFGAPVVEIKYQRLVRRCAEAHSTAKDPDSQWQEYVPERVLSMYNHPYPLANKLLLIPYRSHIQ